MDALLIAALPIALWVVYAFRTPAVTYEMKWVTGKEADVAVLEPAVDQQGDHKVLLLFPENRDCYLFAYSNAFLDYLKSRNQGIIPVTLRLTYSYGRVAYFEMKRLDDYRKDVDKLFMGITGNRARCW